MKLLINYLYQKTILYQDHQIKQYISFFINIKLINNESISHLISHKLLSRLFGHISPISSLDVENSLV